MKIAICVTTRNRRNIFNSSQKQMSRYFPAGGGSEVKQFIVDDASINPIEYAYTHRFESQVGIAAAKNKCLQLAYEWGADHIFLFDDDTHPIAEDWWRPYVESKEPHLMYQFDLPGKPLKELYRDDKIVAYDKTRGAMIYVTREVLDTVGGMNTAYGLYGYEHPDYTTRIHNAGLTTHRAMDVLGSSELLYCLDQDGAIRSSIPSRAKGNAKLYNTSKDSKKYMEFRT